MIARRRTKQQYEEIFEDLMEYTSFTSTADIQTKSDLTKFFGDLQDDAKAKGRVFPLSKRLVFEFASALNRITGRGKVRTVVGNRGRAISRPPFKNIRQARQAQATFTQEGKEIFKTGTPKDKGIVKIVWRDSKGRFAKPPTGPA